MKTSRFTDSEIIAILKQAEAGSPVPELCHEHPNTWHARIIVADRCATARVE
jgi:hypothetical protein